MADRVTTTAEAAANLDQLVQREVDKLLASDQGQRIMRQAFFSNCHIAFVAKSNGGTDEFGKRYPPLAKRTLEKKQRQRQQGAGASGRFWWNIDRRNAWRRNRRNLMSQLQASGMTEAQAKVKASSMAWGRVTAAGGVSINVERGDLEESIMAGSKSPHQIWEVTKGKWTMGTDEKKARWAQDGTRRQPPRPVLPDSDGAAVWIQRGLHLIALKARERVAAVLRRRERARLFQNPSQAARREAARARAAARRILKFERLLETMEDIREMQGSLQDILEVRSGE